MRKALLLFLLLTACSTTAPQYDVVIGNGLIVDGSGSVPRPGGVAIKGDRIVAVGDVSTAHGKQEIDAHGLVIAPGFLNMLSQAPESLIADGRALADIEQGVTLEVMGEGESMGPWSPMMKDYARRYQGDIKYEIQWTTLNEYLEWLTRRGISPNVASFVGAATVREHEIGFEDRAPAPEELARMKDLVRQAMREGALGVSTALIYAPGAYAKTAELIELAKAAGESGGMYISHMRSEGNQLEQAVDELITIAREANVPAEIFHIKAAGKLNWPKLDNVIRQVEAARASGLKITADMYTYTAGATGLDAMMPPWVQEGGFAKWRERLMDPVIRARVAREIGSPSTDWENFYWLAGSADRILLAGFRSDALKPLTGKTLAEVAQMRGKTPVETAIDLVIEDQSRIETIYFIMSDANVKKEVALPWVSFGSDADSPAPEGVFLKSSRHPRAYGNFARLFAKYVRDEHVISLPEAVRKLTSLPAANLKLDRRGMLAPGYFADVAVFDPATIQDHATFEKPHQLSSGVVHVFVNGVQVLRDGEHTNAKPGRVVRRASF